MVRVLWAVVVSTILTLGAANVSAQDAPRENPLATGGTPAAAAPAKWANSENIVEKVRGLGHPTAEGRPQLLEIAGPEGWKHRVTVSVGTTGTDIWLTANLEDVPANAPAERLMRVLESNYNVAPNLFEIYKSEDGRRSLKMVRAVPNLGATNEIIREAIDDLNADVRATRDVWEASKWPAASTTQPAGANWATDDTLAEQIRSLGLATLDNKPFVLKVPGPDGWSHHIRVSLSLSGTNLWFSQNLADLPANPPGDKLARLLEENFNIAPRLFEIVKGEDGSRSITMVCNLPNAGATNESIKALIETMNKDVRETRDLWKTETWPAAATTQPAGAAGGGGITPANLRDALDQSGYANRGLGGNSYRVDVMRNNTAMPVVVLLSPDGSQLWTITDLFVLSETAEPAKLIKLFRGQRDLIGPNVFHVANDAQGRPWLQMARATPTRGMSAGDVKANIDAVLDAVKTSRDIWQPLMPVPATQPATPPATTP